MPKVTVYRQIALLTEGGYIEVAGEQRVRGAVERRYRVRAERPHIDTELAAEMTIDDHRRGFAAAMAVLIAEFNAYLDSDGADPAADAGGRLRLGEDVPRSKHAATDPLSAGCGRRGTGRSDER